MAKLRSGVNIQFASKLDARARLEHRSWAQGVSRQMKSRAPVRTGRLRRTINWQAGREVVVFRSNVDYASYQHYGTRFIRATRYFDITQRQKRELARIYARALRRYILTEGAVGGLRRLIRRISPIRISI